MNAVVSELPSVAKFGNGRNVERLRKHLGAIVSLIAITKDYVDFRSVESNHRKIKIDIERAEKMHLAFQRLLVPRGELRQTIICKNEGALV
jgi:hypothetical protein